MRLLEVKQPNIIVVYGGGFQPFHEGHASSYREAKAAFPGAHFFVAASNVTTERPFEFKEKQFLAQQAGVVDPFIQVGTMSYVNDKGRKVTSTPLNPLEVLQKFNPERDVLVIVRSERDPMKTTDVSYYQPWAGIQGAEPFSKHAYIFVTKKHDFSIAGNPVYSGSQVRELYSGADDKTKLSILQDLYPQSRQLDKIKKIFDKRLSLTESTDIQIPTEDGITWQDIRLMAGEGKLTKKTVLQAIAVIRKQRRSQGVAEGQLDEAKIASTEEAEDFFRNGKKVGSITKVTLKSGIIFYRVQAGNSYKIGADTRQEALRDLKRLLRDQQGVAEDESGMFSKVMSHETSPEAARQIQQQGFKKSRTGIFFNVEGQNYSGGGYGGDVVMAKVSGPIDDILNLEDDNDLPDDLDDFADGEEIADYARSEGYWAWTDGVQFAVLDPRHIQVVKQGVTEDVDRVEAQADYMQGQCMILAVAINQYNPKRYPIGYIWEYNISAGAADVQLDDDEWEYLSPEEQEEISKDISRHSIVHAYVRDRETNEYIDARGRHRELPNLWGRLGRTRFEEFPGTARELIDITAHGDWDEVGDQVNFKRGQPAFDSLAGPAGIKRALDYAVKYLGVEGSKNKLRIGNIVRAVVDGKRVQGEVIGISSDYEQVELWLSGVNDFNPITVDVRDIKPVSEQGMAEASLATMRDYFAGDKDSHDPLEITKQRLYYDPKTVANKRKEFKSQWEYEQWLKKHNLKQISDSEEYNLEEEAANLLEYLRKIHKRWAIVSKKGGRPLVYFKGDGKPSKDWVEKQERRINYFKHKK